MACAAGQPTISTNISSAAAINHAAAAAADDDDDISFFAARTHTAPRPAHRARYATAVIEHCSTLDFIPPPATDAQRRKVTSE